MIRNTIASIFILGILSFYRVGWANLSDTVFTDYSVNPPKYLPWISCNGNPEMLLEFQQPSALRGAKGVAAVKRGYMKQWTEFKKDSWQRFYIRLDSIGDSSSDSRRFFVEKKNLAKTIFLLYVVSEKLQPDQSEEIVNFQLGYDSKRSEYLFLAQLIPSSMKEGVLFQKPIAPGRTYCVETHLDYFATDSVMFSCFVDGVLLGEVKAAEFRRPKFFEPRVGNGPFFFSVPFYFAFDELAYSDNRLYITPQEVNQCSTVFQNDSVTLSCVLPKSAYKDEWITASRYTLFNKGKDRFPLFDIIERSSASFSRVRIPFIPDSGTYFWKISLQNNFGNWGEASQPIRFDMPSRDIKMKIDSAFFSEKNSRKPIERVEPGIWYDFHLHAISRVPWDSILYFLVWVNDTAYTFAHIANKGGEFRSTSNYVYNLSVFGGKYLLYEKAGENTMASTRLNPDLPGVYLDASKGALLVDTSSGWIRFRVRFLAKADSGIWKLSAGAFFLAKRDPIIGIIEGQSNIYSSTIVLGKSEKHFLKRYSIIVILVSLFFAGVLFSRFLIVSRKKVQNTGQNVLLSDLMQDPDFRWIMGYLEAHYKEKIIISSILQEWRVSREFFYKVMARYNQNLPDLVQKFRIEKAKEMLRSDKTKNIEQISFEVGFPAASHFSKAFKNTAGMSPKEYRNKFISQPDLSNKKI